MLISDNGSKVLYCTIHLLGYPTLCAQARLQKVLYVFTLSDRCRPWYNPTYSDRNAEIHCLAPLEPFLSYVADK